MSELLMFRLSTAEPGDLSGLAELDAAGREVADVLAVVGKTEGNGGVNDFSRTLGSRTWRSVVGPDAVAVMSGGTEGVLSPHVTLLVRAAEAETTGLRGAVGVTTPVAPADLGRRPQVTAVADVVRETVAAAGLAAGEVHLVLVKCPLLTSDDIDGLRAGGAEPVCTDTYESMARSRASSALGVALALGECGEDDVDRALSGAADVWSSVASVSSGAEIDACHVVVLGATGAGRYRMRHTVMADAMDADAVTAVLGAVAGEGGDVVQVFAKAEADPSGHVRGRRHTMLTDSDVTSTRHARAAVGGLLAGLVGDPSLYVSGGAENQGPPGGGPVAVVYTLPVPEPRRPGAPTSPSP